MIELAWGWQILLLLLKRAAGLKRQLAFRTRMQYSGETTSFLLFISQEMRNSASIATLPHLKPHVRFGAITLACCKLWEPRAERTFSPTMRLQAVHRCYQESGSRELESAWWIASIPHLSCCLANLVYAWRMVAAYAPQPLAPPAECRRRRP